jgi:FMN reductase
MQSAQLVIVGLGGTTRSNSSSEGAVRISLRAAARCGAQTVLFTGRELMLPLYEPGARRTSDAMRLIKAFRSCHGVIISSPAYHGSISGPH